VSAFADDAVHDITAAAIVVLARTNLYDPDDVRMVMMYIDDVQRIPSRISCTFPSFTRLSAVVTL